MEIKDIIEFLESLREFRINDELPLGTIDYYRIDDMIKYLKLKNKK